MTPFNATVHGVAPGQEMTRSCGHARELTVENPFTREQWRVCVDCPTDRCVGYARRFEERT